MADQKFRSIEDILKDEKTRTLFTNCIDEAVKCKLRAAVEQETIKDLRKMCVEAGVNPRLFMSYLTAAYNNDYNMRLEFLGQQTVLIEYHMGVAQIEHDKK